jgi:hypothetical protein
VEHAIRHTRHCRASGLVLLRNYDLSPDLNEGLLLRSEWTGRPVMGMVEFLWGLSDGMGSATYSQPKVSLDSRHIRYKDCYSS